MKSQKAQQIHEVVYDKADLDLKTPPIVQETTTMQSCSRKVVYLTALDYCPQCFLRCYRYILIY